MSKRQNGLALMGCVVAFLLGMPAGAVLASVPTPYALTTIYGKGDAPIGVIQGADGNASCDPNTMAMVTVAPKQAAEINDEGQRISIVDWPNSDHAIVLRLTRSGDTGSVWSYRTVIATHNDTVIGIGGLLPLGVAAQEIRVVVSIGNDQVVPDQLTLCRLTEGVG